MLIAPSHTRCCKNILKDIKINFLDVDKNISIDYFKKVITPTNDELKKHKEYLKNNLKKNFF